jgi:predicted transcriptional regulator
MSMATDRRNDLRAFQSFVEEKLSNGGATLTLDEALDLWEYENSSSETERQETLEAIRRGIADVEAGRVRPAREALAELRRKHNLSELS